jgi:hypothetical protein
VAVGIASSYAPLARDEPVRAMFWPDRCSAQATHSYRQEAVSRYPGLMSAIPRKLYLCEIGMREAGSPILQSKDVPFI